MKLLELLLHNEIDYLDFSLNKNWPENDDNISEFSRTLWKIIGDKCGNLSKLIIPKELVYSSTLNNVIKSGWKLTHLTLKRNVPNNIFLNLIGT